MRVDVLIAVPNMAVDLVMDALTNTVLGVRTNIDRNTNVLAGVMTAFEFANSEPFEGFSC